MWHARCRCNLGVSDREQGRGCRGADRGIEQGGFMDRAGRRVVVTGMGMATPVGLDVESTWEGLREGRGGGGPGTLFDARTSAPGIAAELKGFSRPQELGREGSRWEGHSRNTK